MKVQSCSWAAAVALALGLTLSGCTIGTPAAGDAPSKADRTKDRKHAKAAGKKRRAPKQAWVCSWAPTFDDDWHNDVLCDNGIASERPRLREWDDFVERSELMESAQAYARQLNAG